MVVHLRRLPANERNPTKLAALARLARGKKIELFVTDRKKAKLKKAVQRRSLNGSGWKRHRNLSNGGVSTQIVALGSRHGYRRMIARGDLEGEAEGLLATLGEGLSKKGEGTRREGQRPAMTGGGATHEEPLPPRAFALFLKNKFN